MAFTFQDIEITIGDGPSGPGFNWAVLRMGMLDERTNHSPFVQLRLTVVDRPEATMAEVEAEVHAYALEALQNALSILRETSIAQLKAQQREAEACSAESSRTLFFRPPG